MPTAPTVTVSQLKEDLILCLSGEWRTFCLPEIKHKLSALKLPQESKVVIDLSSVDFLDTASAYLLKKFLKKLKRLKISYKIKEGSPTIMATFHMVNEFTPSPEPRTEQTSRFSLIFLLNFLGKMALEPLKTLLEALSFLGEVTIGMIKILIHPRRLRFITLVDLIHKVGASALPIVGLISFLIGVVLVYQGADQLRRFGAEIFTINLLAVSALRELGILLTAIVVAGRSGSAYTAQLGFMKLNQEIDALHVLGIDPIEVLVVPRILALLIVLPLLTFFADIMALIGGGIATYFLIGVGPDDFAKHLLLSIGEWTFWTGIIKAPVFAFFIGLVACFEGLRVSGGAESVGKHTTQSVVEGIFLVIIFDAAFSILFSVLGI
ncbi:putative phospholipid ABC transporter permease protein MlaE [Caedimonas varicaedens]|uniref:Putative phospholipid ABC transporter permease protein MlaE n=1 Tax=Caedimonas varicaedens TaxID=1629334 RepID=A0A0K8MA70_9PROT|nr:putative phospholipid ABC transporter permease protein MlaE [Caedimonas varicaedens]